MTNILLRGGTNDVKELSLRKFKKENWIMFTQSFKKVLIFVPVLLTLACSTLTPKPAPSAVDIEKEEQAVYSFFVGCHLFAITVVVCYS